MNASSICVLAREICFHALLAQLVEASDLGSEGSGFESLMVYHFNCLDKRGVLTQHTKCVVLARLEVNFPPPNTECC